MLDVIAISFEFNAPALLKYIFWTNKLVWYFLCFFEEDTSNMWAHINNIFFSHIWYCHHCMDKIGRNVHATSMHSPWHYLVFLLSFTLSNVPVNVASLFAGVSLSSSLSENKLWRPILSSLVPVLVGVSSSKVPVFAQAWLGRLDLLQGYFYLWL